jgi:hypothetical protein
VNIEARKTSRIVVALNPEDARDFALDLARFISLTTTPELLGLFVESAHLLEHARSRFAREIMLTGRERALDRAVLERALRAQSAQARAHFEAAAARLGLPHTFEVARGEVAAELLRCAAEAEALVVSLTREARGAGAWLGAALRQLFAAPLPLLLLAREGWLSGRSIAIVIEDAEVTELTLQVAARLAAHSKSPIAALLTGPAAGAHAQRHARVVRALQGRGIELSRIQVLGAHDASTIARAARACEARLLVLPSAERETDAPLIEELLRRLPSALLLVRG